MDTVLAVIFVGLSIFCIADAPKVHNGGYCPPDKAECQQGKK
jgi:hypothetical protein